MNQEQEKKHYIYIYIMLYVRYIYIYNNKYHAGSFKMPQKTMFLDKRKVQHVDLFVAHVGAKNQCV